MAGYLASLLNGIPNVVSANSLGPLRPWKAEQLGGGYAVSSWIERTAYENAAASVAVSGGTRDDIQRSYREVDHDRVHVYNHGIHTAAWHTIHDPVAHAERGVNPPLPRLPLVRRLPPPKCLSDWVLRAGLSRPAGLV